MSGLGFRWVHTRVCGARLAQDECVPKLLLPSGHPWVLGSWCRGLSPRWVPWLVQEQLRVHVAAAAVVFMLEKLGYSGEAAAAAVIHEAGPRGWLVGLGLEKPLQLRECSSISELRP